MHVDMRTYLCIAILCTSVILEHGAVSEIGHMLPVVPFCGALRENPRLSASFAHWTGQASAVQDPSTCRCIRLGLLHIDWD